MADRGQRAAVSRRSFLRRLAAARPCRRHALARARSPSAQDALLRALIEQNQQTRIRPGLRLRLAHHPDAEGVAADAVAGDRADDRAGDRPDTRRSSARGGWPHGPAGRAAAARQPACRASWRLRQRLARGRRSRRRLRRDRRLRFLRRGRGAPLPGAPRHHRRRGVARADLQGAQRSGRRAARPAQDQRRAAAHLERQSRRPLRGRATSRPRRSRRSRTASWCRAISPWSASPTGRRPTSTAASSRSISIRTGRCRSRSCGAISFRRCRPSRTI